MVLLTIIYNNANIYLGLVEEPVIVKNGDTVIDSLISGRTKTLNIGLKYVPNNIKIGPKTLNTGNKFIPNNIKITVETLLQ